jgi:galactoside O-acetyltransferase
MEFKIKKIIKSILRNRHLKLHITPGSNFKIDDGITFGKGVLITARSGGFVSIGANTTFNQDVIVNADLGGRIEIGPNCLIGPRVIFRSANHMFNDRSSLIKNQGHKFDDIVLEEDVWIGANVVILPGVRIGKGCVVGAGAVVTKNLPDFSICWGVPAKPHKFR